MKKKLPKLIVLLGPTASGKTSLAIKLAKKFNGEIVNADSRNIYKGMYIGTASPFSPYEPEARVAPAAALRARNERDLASIKFKKTPHHLFHYVESLESYSVGRYKQDAITVIDDIISRGKVPILVGGTGLYIWAVVDNLEIPEVPPNPKLREQFMKPSFVLRLYKELGLDNKTLSFGLRPWSVSRRLSNASQGGQKLGVNNKALSNLLFDILTKVDPEATNFVQKDNPRRIIRALEVILWANNSPKRMLRLRQRFGLDTTSIIKFSDLRQKGAPLYDVLQIGIKIPLPELDKGINTRVDKQIKAGLVKETKKVYSHILQNMRIKKKLSFGLRLRQKLGFEQKKVWQLPSMTSLGYRQIGMYLRDEVSREEAIRILKRDTRRYARRQMTWFRRDKRIIWLEGKEKIGRAIYRFLKKK